MELERKQDWIDSLQSSLEVSSFVNWDKGNYEILLQLYER